MSDEKKPAEKPKKRPSADDVKKALGESASFASIDGATVVIVYPSLDVYSARTSADVEALRGLYEIAESSASAHDPARERLLNPNTPISSAHLPSPDGAQRVVVVFA
jgi:hypothetical protein